MDTSNMKLIQITDLHLATPGSLLHGLDPLDRLDRCLGDVVDRHPDADICVISGDLTDRGEPAAYQALKSRLQGFPCPVVLMLGNHDDRQNFRTAFPDHPVDGNGFVQTATSTDWGDVLCLDTLASGRREGDLCSDRLDWFRKKLENAGDRRILVFMHHPPFDIGIPRLDVIRLDQPEEFASIVSRLGQNIRHLFFGHVHRPVFGSWNRVPHSALPAINHQVPYDPVTPVMAYSNEPPAYAVVLADGETIVIHQEFFLHRDALPTAG